MTLRLITAPTAEPVSLETAKSFLRVDVAADDALITSLLLAAREQGEELSRRAFLTQTWEMTFDDWPSDSLLPMPRPRLQSVTSVKYLDEDAVEATWTDYTVDARSEPGRIIFHSLPSAALLESGAITVRFAAGYGATSADVPERIKAAILSLVAYWYETRDLGDVPAGVKNAFIGERVVWF